MMTSVEPLREIDTRYPFWFELPVGLLCVYVLWRFLEVGRHTGSPALLLGLSL
jgi:hypothetical protein